MLASRWLFVSLSSWLALSGSGAAHDTVADVVAGDPLALITP